MNKGALVSEVSKRSDVPLSAVARVVDAALDVIRDRVSRGERVTLAGFGTFERVRRNARIGRNPRTGEAVRIPARNTPAFRPGAAFRRTVESRRRTSVPKATRRTLARRS